MMIAAFLRGKCSRKSCYECKFKQKYRLADITLADYWGIEKIAPELDDDKGISSIYINSAKGERVLEAISDRVFVQKMDLDMAVAHNEAMVESETLSSDRGDFLKDLRRKSFDMVYGKYIYRFAFNTKIQACENNHAFYGNACPTCGKPVNTEYTRIVGFYTPIKTWSKERTSEYKMRRWEQINKTSEEI